MRNIPLSDIRTDYRKSFLDENEVAADPFGQFEKWFEEVLHSEIAEPNAMTLATASAEGKVSARIVLLKNFDEEGFYFYTNYESRKGNQIKENPHGALVFFWKELERQVRIEGLIRKTPEENSIAYFNSRPEGSRLGAWASPQSKIIPGRSFLENELKKLEAAYKTKAIPRPDFWGGFILQPSRVEFWQGRSNRLHDRIQYRLQQNGKWIIERLAP